MNLFSYGDCFEFQMGRSAGYNIGGTHASHRPLQQQHALPVSNSSLSFAPGNNQDLLHLHGSDMFQPSHSTYHSQVWRFITVNGFVNFVVV